MSTWGYEVYPLPSRSRPTCEATARCYKPAGLHVRYVAKGRTFAEKWLCDLHAPKGTRLYEEWAA